MSYQQDPRFNPEDTVQVAGDTNNKWQHMVKKDGRVKLIGYDPNDDSWEVEVIDTDEEYYVGRKTWVAQEDLRPDFKPVSPDEEAAVIASILKGDGHG